MISGSSVQNFWFPDPGSLYASPTDQSSSFASTQPSPAMVALKPEAKMISSQYLTANMPTFIPQSFQHHRLEKFVQSVYAASGGGIERTRPVKRRPRPVPEEKKDEAYKERRRKNNDSARRSRELRRHKEDEIQQRNNELEKENENLRHQINALRIEVLHFKQCYYGIVGGNINETFDDARSLFGKPS